MRRAALLLSSSVLLALTGCYASASPGVPTPEEVEPPSHDLACDPGELALAWRASGAEVGSVHRPVSLAVAPGGALFVRTGLFESVVARMTDGAVVAPLRGPDLSLDASWSRSLCRTGCGTESIECCPGRRCITGLVCGGTEKCERA